MIHNDSKVSDRAPTTASAIYCEFTVHILVTSEETDIYEKAMRTLEFSFHYSSSVTNSDT